MSTRYNLKTIFNQGSRSLCSFLILVMLFSLAGLNKAASVAAAGDTGSTLTFLTNADSYVREASVNSNYGTDIQLWVDGDTGASYETYLKFSVSGIIGSIQSATLRVYSISSTVDGPAVYATNANWAETGITWATRPARTSSSLDDKAAIVTGVWLEYNVLPVITGDGTYSFALVPTSIDSVSFSARTGTQPPQLVIVSTIGSMATNTPANTPLPPTATNNIPLPTVTPTMTPTITLTPSITSTIDPDSFMFASMGDAQGDVSNFSATVNQISSLNPNFAIFNGDLEDAGFSSTEMNSMTSVLKNANLFNQTFAVRGNHDDHIAGSAVLWENYFETAPNLRVFPARVSNYVSLDSSSDTLNYSFVYGNSIFIGLDTPGDVDYLTSTQLTFLDSRLTYAESARLVHAFIYFHGPMYCVESVHCDCPTRTDSSCTPTTLISVINKHPIVSAFFHGHEHILGWTHIDNSRLSTIAGSFEEFLTSSSGSTNYNSYLYPARMDYVYMAPEDTQVFATITVNGNSFTVNFYKTGTDIPVWTKTFTEGIPVATNTPTFTPIPTQTFTPTLTPSNTPTPTFTVIRTNTPLPPTATFTPTFTATPTNTLVPITNTGFHPPTANSAVTTKAGDNNGYETTPANAYLADGLFAVDTNSGTNNNTSCTNNGKDKHNFDTYSLNVPSTATIQGIEVKLTGKVNSTTGSPKFCIQLSWNGGKTWTNAKSTSTLSTTNAAYLLGTSIDTWGRAWSGTDFTNANFRLRIIDVSGSTSSTFSLDQVAVQITYR